MTSWLRVENNVALSVISAAFRCCAGRKAVHDFVPGNGRIRKTLLRRQA